jgi:hypothetical protein
MPGRLVFWVSHGRCVALVAWRGLVGPMVLAIRITIAPRRGTIWPGATTGSLHVDLHYETIRISTVPPARVFAARRGSTLRVKPRVVFAEMK